jgi:methylamine dehydrogenase accessory protein MauD
MTEALLVSNVMLWVVAIALGVVVLALARQIGLLHERSAPLGAMMADKGPEVGDEAPELEVEDFQGRPIRVGGKGGPRDTLLLFLAPNCPMCNQLLPTARSMARSDGLDVVVISDGPREDHERFLRKHAMGGIPYVVSAEVGMRYQVGRVPHAVLVDGAGKIRAKGLVNTREHLESLVEAKTMNHASLQEYLKARSGPTEAEAPNL